MTLRQFFAVLTRRWRVSVPGVLVTLVLCGAGLAVVSPTYKAEATLVILPSASPPQQPAGSNATAPVATNPYLAFDSSLRIAADVLGRSVSDQQTATALAGRGAAGTYTVVVAPDSSGPLLKIDVEAADAASANLTTELVVKEISTRLQALQLAAGAPPNTWINVSEVSRTPAAGAYKKMIEVIALLMAVGLTATVGLAVTAENRSRRPDAAAVGSGAGSRSPSTRRVHGNGGGGMPDSAPDSAMVPPDPFEGGTRADDTPAVPDTPAVVLERQPAAMPDEDRRAEAGAGRSQSRQ